MRWTLVLMWQSDQGVAVHVLKFWRYKSAFRLKNALEAWHLMARGAGVCYCVLISPRGGYA